jgi:hypothetical protein
MLAGPSSVTAEATIAEMDHQGTSQCFVPARTSGCASLAIKTLLDGRIWLSIQWAWSGLRMFLPERQNQRTPHQA